MLTFFFAATSLIFAVLTGLFFFRVTRKAKQIREQEKELQRKLYESNLLREITEKIGYSLNIEAISETIALTVRSVFDLSTVSYAIKGEDLPAPQGKTIVIKTFLRENVTLSYTQEVSRIIFSAMKAIEADIANYQVTQAPNKPLLESYSDTYFDAVPLSYFNIPLVVENEFVGMINISSRKKGIYQDQDMSMLYKIVNSAQKAIGRLNDVIETEKAKLNSMISSLPSGAILFSFERNENKGNFSLSVINQAAKNFLHISGQASMAEVISKFPPGAGLVETIKNVINGKKSAIIEDVRIFDNYFVIYLTPVFLHNTQDLTGVSIVLRDMTLEKKIEKMRQDFTNMIVHELRAPVTAIRGASSLLLSQTLEESEEEKMLRVISNSAREMLSTISELLDVGKIQESKFTIKKVKSDFPVILREHLDVFSYACREKGIAMSFDIDPDIPQFYFDPGRIGQVINNLLSNSIKFTKEGGIIHLKIAKKEGEIEVEVEDNGIGIPQGKKAFLFTKFGQIYPAGGGVREGFGQGESSGLGLFISKEIIESHGGKIWIESEEGKGTKAYFTLPLILEEPRKENENEIVRNFAN